MRPPVITDPTEAFSWLSNHWSPDGEDAAEVLEVALGRVGRLHGAGLFIALHDEFGEFPRAVAALTSNVWSLCDYPQDAMPGWAWIALFEEAGYTVDGRHSDRPTSPVRLYRGSPEARRLNMAWTSDFEVARRFASGELLVARQQGHVWTALVEPERLLAQDNDRQEFEYVIDTDGLTVERWAPASATSPTDR